MTKNKLILIITAMAFILSGCFTNRLSKKIENNFQPKEEFAAYLNLEGDKLIANEGNGTVNIFKGIYLGEKTINDKIYYNLQFEGMLKGANRVLDVYVDKDTNSFPEFYEVETMQQGEDAFLFLSEYKFFQKIAGEYFNKLEEIENPELIYDYAHMDKSQIPDTCLIMGLYYFYDKINSLNSESVTNIYNKEPNNRYTVKQIRSISKADEVGKHFHLKYIARSKTKKNLNKMLYVLTVPADIITSPIQLIGRLILTRSFNKGTW